VGLVSSVLRFKGLCLVFVLLLSPASYAITWSEDSADANNDPTGLLVAGVPFLIGLTGKSNLKRELKPDHVRVSGST
jgi:hypothetical protein